MAGPVDPQRTIWLVALFALLVAASACGAGRDSPPVAADRSTTATSATSASTPPPAPPPAPATSSTTSPAPSTPTTPLGEALVVRQGDPSRRLVALTFDAGSDRGYAEEILDTLAAEGVVATFGITGRWAEVHPTLVDRMAAEGHQIVNHSYDHRSFTGLSTGSAPLTFDERLDQLTRADAAIEAAAGVSSRPWFRPPYGDEDASVRADVAGAGYGYELLWTVDSRGWLGEPADVVTHRCLAAAGPGVIYLFHVGAESTDVDALPGIIRGLRSQGFGFATAAGIL
jgi:peptidoglycan/xylan/chitin deacetylase (PgdA/CDA1 family)